MAVFSSLKDDETMCWKSIDFLGNVTVEYVSLDHGDCKICDFEMYRLFIDVVRPYASTVISLNSQVDLAEH